MTKSVNGLFTHEEFLARYRQGYVEGGGTNPPDGYTADDLRQVFDEARDPDGHIAALAKASFEKGFQQGNKETHNEKIRQMREEYKVEIAAACKAAHDLGYEKGTNASDPALFAEGERAGRQETLEFVAHERTKIASQVIEKFFNSGFSFPESSHFVVKKFSRMPVSTSKYKKMPQVFGTPLAGPLRLLHYRVAPIRVGTRFSLFYVLPLALAAYFSYKQFKEKYSSPRIIAGPEVNLEKLPQKEIVVVPSKIVAEPEIKPEKLPQKEILCQASDYGIDGWQHETLSKVVKACNQLRGINPQILQIDAFSREDAKMLADGLLKCDAQTKVHDEMLRITSLRRRLGVPPRENSYSRPPIKEIEDLNALLIHNAANKQTKDTIK